MIRILIISPTSEWGGPEAGLLELLRNIDRGQFVPSIVFPAPGPYLAQFEEMEIPIHIAPTASLEKSGLPWRLLSFGPELLTGALGVAKIARNWQADLLFTNCSASIVGPIAARLVRRPHITLVREMWTRPRILTHPLYSIFYHGSARILTVTNAIREVTFSRYDSQKVETVYDLLDPTWFAPASDLQALRDELGLKPRQPAICTAARICPQKGIHSFIEAAAHLREIHPDAVFLILGDIPRSRFQPYKDELLAFVRQHRLEETVRFLGWRSDVKQIMALCTVNVLASIGPEGAPRVIPEGWAVRVPAVVADHSGPAEVVRDGVDGLHFRTGDAADLAAKIDRLLSEPETRAAMQKAGRQRAQQLFGARENARRMESIWQQTVSEFTASHEA